ncbi:MAG: 30S ribosomal protein S17 [Candidatus Omnitrophica bacterium]|nr:30S ribosomal protein S17 [Candidatus Omnitrophota bacterium]
MGKQKEYTGTVTSNKMQKTAVVKIMHLSKHAKYGRITKRYATFKAHDEKSEAKIGDTVRIVETRPLSKDKHFRIVEIVKKVAIPEIALKDEEK